MEAHSILSRPIRLGPKQRGGVGGRWGGEGGPMVLSNAVPGIAALSKN